MKHSTKKVMGFAAALLVTATASAATDQYSTIASARVGIGSPATGIIEMADNSSSKPACATYSQGGGALGRWFAVDLSTDGGKEAMKLAQAALLSGKQVRITGSGTCTVNSNKENLSAIYLYK